MLFRRLLLVIVLSCIACYGLFFYFGQTTQGLRTLIYLAKKFTPGQLTIAQTQGKLFSSLDLHGIHYKNSSLQIDINHAHLAWNLREIVTHKLTIYTLEAEGIMVHVSQSAPSKVATKPSSEPATDFLNYAKVISASLKNIQIKYNDAPTIKITEINLYDIDKHKINFLLKAFDGDIVGSVDLGLTNVTSWNTQVVVHNIDLGSTLPAWAGKISLAFNSQGQLDKNNQPNFNVTVNNFHGVIKNNPIKGDIAFNYQPTLLTIQRGEIFLADASIILSGSVNQNWQLKWMINIPRVGTLLPQGHGSVLSHGTILGPRFNPQIKANLAAQDFAWQLVRCKKINGHLDWNLTTTKPSELSLNVANFHYQDYALQSATLKIITHLYEDINFYRLKSEISLDNKPYIIANLQTKKTIQADLKDQVFTADIQTQMNNLQMLDKYIPGVDNLNGKLTSLIKVHGTINRPEVTLTADLSQGQLRIPSIGAHLHDIKGHLMGDLQNISYAGQLSVDKQIVAWQGKTQIDKDFATQAHIKGNDLYLLNLAEYKGYFSPDVDLVYADKMLSVSGSIAIPKGTISPQDYSQVSTLPSEVVFVGQKTKPSADSVDAAIPNLNLKVSLGNDIHVHYQHLTTKIRGNITVTKNTNRPTTAVGELFTSGGMYSAYGHDLNIKTGRFIYTGGLITNPGLDIKAIRSIKIIGNLPQNDMSNMHSGIRVIVVGLHVSGNANNPISTLFSDSSLSDADILSYLILGVPQSQASGEGAQALMTAASALNLGGDSSSKILDVTNKIKNTLGLTELNVESTQTFDPNKNDTVSNTSLVVGKNISKKLSVHYSRGLFNPISIFSIRYQISKRWALQSDASTLDNGADILYSIERN